jgi:hypothetical protein
MVVKFAHLQFCTLYAINYFTQWVINNTSHTSIFELNTYINETEV